MNILSYGHKIRTNRMSTKRGQSQLLAAEFDGHVNTLHLRSAESEFLYPSVRFAIRNRISGWDHMRFNGEFLLTMRLFGHTVRQLLFDVPCGSSG